MLAQEVPSSSAGPSYLMRMERMRRGQDACVLVRGDGQYHVEVLYSARTDIFEGVLPGDELRDLVKLISQDRLFRLQQKDIRSQLLESGVDQLTLSILRPGYWQNLEFPSAESRDSLRDMLDPLLKWFDRIQKEKARKLPEDSGRNNCNPPREIQLKPRADQHSTSGSGDSAAAGESRPVPMTYIVQMFTAQLGTRQVENMCLIVFDSGAYHRVRRIQKLGSREAKAAVLEGVFSSDDLHFLRAILDSEEMQAYASDTQPPRQFGEATITRLIIPRSPKPQQIIVWKNFDLRGVGAAPIKGVDDHGSKLVEPLNEWLITKLPENKEVETPDPANPNCLPAH